MRDWSGKRYWLIGASEGLGRALAFQLSRVGTELIVSCRDEAKLAALVAELPGRGRAVPVDVSDRAAVERAAADVGEIDGMVYLAGAYSPMKATEWDAERAEAMADTIFTGCVRAVGAVLPDMLARGRGHLVLTGSLFALRGSSGAIGYGASTAGIMSLAESLRADLGGTGVEVQLVNPGFVRTGPTDGNDSRMPFAMEPEHAAREIFEHMNGSGFARSFPLGLSLLFRFSRFVPDRLIFSSGRR